MAHSSVRRALNLSVVTGCFCVVSFMSGCSVKSPAISAGDQLAPVRAEITVSKDNVSKCDGVGMAADAVGLALNV